MKWASILLVGFLLSSCEPIAEQQSELFDENERVVLKVIDGDTIHLLDPASDKPEKVRLIGIDAPEMRDSQHKKAHPFGVKSKEILERWIGESKVILEYDIRNTDRYGRTLAYVYLPDGTFLNAKMMEEGYATLLTIQPNSKYADLFFSLQQKARNAKKGIWAEEVIM